MKELLDLEQYLKGSEIEGIALSAYLFGKWNKRVSPFIDATLKSLMKEPSTAQFELSQLIFDYKENLGVDFINSTSDKVEEIADASYFIGLSEAMISKADDESEETAIAAIIAATLSFRRKVVDTIKKWYANTQGRFFERFILPKLESLRQSVVDVPEDQRVITLDELEAEYKKVCGGESYWDSVGHLNTAMATAIASADCLHAQGVASYRIVAKMDAATCNVCAMLDGTIFTTNQAQDYKLSLLSVENADDIKNIHPWPTVKDLKRYDDLSLSPYPLPPFHAHCRCVVQAI